MKHALNRLFADDGRILIVAMDHTAFLNTTIDGLVNYERTVRAVVPAGADAFLSPLGSARAYQEAYGRAAIICSVDPTGVAGEFAVDEAARLGVDAVKCMLYPFGDDTVLNESVGLAARAHAHGLPFLAEPIPGGFSNTDMRTPEIIAAGCRLSMEAGADIVKTFYPGTPEGMRKVVDYAGVPVVVLGGHKKDSLAALYQEAYDAVILGGASGVAIGTNIWTSADPAGVTRGLAALIHEGASVEQAVAAANIQGS